MIRNFFIIFSFCFFYSVGAAETIEVPDNYEMSNFKTIKLLNEITNYRIDRREKTAGFDYRYQSSWYTPFTFDIYIGRYRENSTNSIIRVEADKRGEEKLYKTILQQEFLKKEPSEDGKKPASIALQSKSHILGQGINLISPSASILYTSYKSPVYNDYDSFSRFSLYLTLDFLIAGLSAAYINNTVKGKSLQDDLLLQKGPSKAMVQNRTAGFFFGSLLLFRMYHSLDVYQGIGTHNRISEMSYTFRF